MIDITFELNGKTVSTSVEDGETLLEMIRDRLGLTGTKRGCEVGECGACTVLVDGVPTDSCLYMAALADGHSLMTIEGMADNRRLSVLQQAFVDEGAVQCGFCSPGLILAAYALLLKNPHPTTEEIKTGLAGNFCRCGAYGALIKAIQKSGETMFKAIQKAGDAF